MQPHQGNYCIHRRSQSVTMLGWSARHFSQFHMIHDEKQQSKMPQASKTPSNPTAYVIYKKKGWIVKESLFWISGRRNEWQIPSLLRLNVVDGSIKKWTLGFKMWQFQAQTFFLSWRQTSRWCLRSFWSFSSSWWARFASSRVTRARFTSSL